MPASVELHDIHKSYGDNEVIKGVSLTIDPGEFVVFVGPSGCGKSTLLRMIAGLEEITSGELRFDDSVVNDWDPARRNIGMVFQSYALYPHMTVEQNIGFGLKLAKRPRRERNDRVEEALRVLQLIPLRHHKPSELSGGQRQRVAIGRAIVRKPKVFLFDEPLSNLDASLRGQMRMEIGKLHQRLKNTVVYVTHDQVEAMTLADRIVVFEGGHIRQIGTPLDLYERPANRFVAAFIGTPTMGFLPGRIVGRDDRGLEVAIGPDHARTMVFPAYRDAKIDGNDVTLGIRPEHCRCRPSDQAVQTGTVAMMERLGADTFAFIEVPGSETPIAVRLASADRSLSNGQEVGLSFDPADVHLFGSDGITIPPAGR